MKFWIIPFFLLLFLSEGYADNRNLDSLISFYQNSAEGFERISAIQNLFEHYINNDPSKAKEYAIMQMEYSQSIRDTLGIGQASYNMAVLHNNKSNYDSATYWYEEAYAFFKQIDNIERMALAKYGLAILDYYRGDYDPALELLGETIQLMTRDQKDSLNVGAELQLMGMIHIRKGNLNIALKEVLHTVRIFQTLKNNVRLADSYNMLGGIETQLGNYRKSIEYNQLALKIYQDQNDQIYIAQALNDIGNTYFYLKEYDEAISYLLQSAEISRQMGSKNIESTNYYNLGKVYLSQKLYGQAEEVLLKGLRIAEETQNSIKTIEASNILGQCYVEMGKPDLSLPYLKRAIELAGQTGSQEAQKQAYFYRSMARETMGNTVGALEDFKAYTRLEKIIFNADKSRQIEELRTLFDLETKENEIKIQQNAIQLLEQKSQISRLQKILLGSGLFLLSLTLGLGWYAFRQKMKKNELEKQKMDAELHFKSRELTTKALHLAKKNETLENLLLITQRINETDNQSGYQDLIKTISSDLRDDKGWDTFAKFFEEVHPDFFSKAALLYPDLSPGEYRLMALIKMNLSSKEMANILHISLPGIKKARQRLRKKMGLETGDSLEKVVISL